MRIKHIIVTTVLAFFVGLNGGCENEQDAQRSRDFQFDQRNYEKLNSIVLSKSKRRGDVKISEFEASEQTLLKELGITSVYMDNRNNEKWVQYTIHTSGITTSGSMLAVLFSEEIRGPVVSDLLTARRNGDDRVLLYQVLGEKWYLESIEN